MEHSFSRWDKESLTKCHFMLRTCKERGKAMNMYLRIHRDLEFSPCCLDLEHSTCYFYVHNKSLISHPFTFYFTNIKRHMFGFRITVNTIWTWYTSKSWRRAECFQRRTMQKIWYNCSMIVCFENAQTSHSSNRIGSTILPQYIVNVLFVFKSPFYKAWAAVYYLSFS